MTTITDKLAEAHRLGATGAEPTEEERLLFEQWMRGHCWALCATWNGKQYVSDAEQGGCVDPRAMNTRQLFAAWRDRAALAAYASQQAEPSSGSSAAAPGLCSGSSEPSDARVEAAAKALLARRELKLEHLTDKAREHYLEDVRAVLKAADAVSAVAVPDGFVLVPDKATPLIREALRIGMRREVPSDELCDIRWRAAIAAAKDSEQKGGV